MTNSQNTFDWKKNVEVRYQGENIFLRLISIVTAIMEFVLGIKRRGELADSADTFKLSVSHYSLWVIKNREEETYIHHGKINAYAVGFSKKWFLFKRVSCTLYVAGMGPVKLVVKDATEDELKEKFDAAVRG